MELLDHKLNEAETEHAQKLILGMYIVYVYVYVCWRSVTILIPCSIESAEEKLEAVI